MIDIKHDEMNLNIGTDRGRKVIRKSLGRLGAGRSIVLDSEGNIIAGNKTYEAYKELLGREPVIVEVGQPGWEEADVIVAPTEGDKLVAVKREDMDLYSEEDRRARELSIVDNRSAELGLQWDMQSLREQWKDGQLDYVFSKAEKIRMDEEAARKAIQPSREVQDTAKLDELDEIRNKWETAQGDIWQLGDHVMIIGSSTEFPASSDIFLDVSGGQKANMLFTSPPYWIGKDYEEEETYEEVDQFIANMADVAAEIVTEDFGRIVINTGLGALHRKNSRLPMEYDLMIHRYQQAFREKGWYVRHVRIYTKLGGVIRPSFGVVRSPLSDTVLPAFEYIMYLTNSDVTPEFLMTMYNPEGESRGTNKIPYPWVYKTVWDDININRAAEMMHIAGMPLMVAERYIMLYTLPEEIIFEPFLGSGTTIIAAERYSRRVIGFELDPKYAAACLERYLIATGKRPKRL